MAAGVVAKYKPIIGLKPLPGGAAGAAAAHWVLLTCLQPCLQPAISFRPRVRCSIAAYQHLLSYSAVPCSFYRDDRVDDILDTEPAAGRQAFTSAQDCLNACDDNAV